MELTGWTRYILFEVLGPILCSNSLKRLKRKQLKNKVKNEPIECYVKENRIVPDDDKIVVTNIKSQEDVKNIVNVEEKEVKVAGMEKVSKFIDRALSEDKRKLEWHVVVNVIDNFFFFLFLLTIVISSLVVLIQPKPES